MKFEWYLELVSIGSLRHKTCSYKKIIVLTRLRAHGRFVWITSGNISNETTEKKGEVAIHSSWSFIELIEAVAVAFLGFAVSSLLYQASAVLATITLNLELLMQYLVTASTYLQLH